MHERHLRTHQHSPFQYFIKQVKDADIKISSIIVHSSWLQFILSFLTFKQIIAKLHVQYLSVDLLVQQLIVANPPYVHHFVFEMLHTYQGSLHNSVGLSW